MPTLTPNLIKPPFNYTGGKFNLLPQILPHFDQNKSTFVDVFMGGGSVYVNILDLYTEVWANDVIPELVECHKQISDPAFVARVKDACVAPTDATGYGDLRKRFNETRQPELLLALMVCCTNNMMRFNASGGFNQTFGKRTFNKQIEKKAHAFSEALRKKTVQFSCRDFEAIPIIADAQYYFDPPYAQTEAGYNKHWTRRHDERLLRYIQAVEDIGASWAFSGMRGNHKGAPESWIVSELSKDFTVHDLVGDYSKVSRKKSNEQGIEVLITGAT